MSKTSKISTTFGTLVGRLTPLAGLVATLVAVVAGRGGRMRWLQGQGGGRAALLGKTAPGGGARVGLVAPTAARHRAGRPGPKTYGHVHICIHITQMKKTFYY